MKKDIPFSNRREVVDEMAEKIEQTLNAFDIPIKVVKAIEGLHEYHFHLKTLKPVRMRTIESFEQDLRYALGSSTVEIQAPLPDETLIGITVPKKSTVPLLPWSEALKTKGYTESGDLVVPLGHDEFNEEVFLSIRDLPHLLVGGVTGSGKSVLVHSIINALILKHRPDQLRFILIDPKRTELTVYEKIPHLLTEIILDPKKVIISLKWCIREMERRLDVLQKNRCQNIASYLKIAGHNPKHADEKVEPMPYIVVIIDEISDLMAAYPKELETNVVRLLQMSRAVGIHLITTTQRPSVNVVTGSMKANIPTRIAFQVLSQIDSRTILDQSGAEKLTGKGDMLYLSYDAPRPRRIQGYYLSEQEIKENVKNTIKKYGVKDVDETITKRPNVDIFMSDDDAVDDDLYEEAKEAVIKSGKASTSLLQRTLSVGYSRAARLIDLLEENGIISPADGSRPRDVIVVTKKPRTTD